MRIAVTGANGSLGSRFVEHARNIGHEVEPLARTGAGFEVPKVAPDVVLHLAWGGSEGAARNDAAVQWANVTLTLAAQDLALFTGARFVGVGTVTELESPPLNFHEAPGELPAGNYLYGFAKSVARVMSYARATSAGGNWTWLRLANVYAPGAMEGRYVHTLASKIARGESWTIGSRGDSTLVLLTLDDALKALLAACQPLGSGRCWEAASVVVTQRELVDGLEAACGREAHIDFGDRLSQDNYAAHHNILGADSAAASAIFKLIASDVARSL